MIKEQNTRLFVLLLKEENNLTTMYLQIDYTLCFLRRAVNILKIKKKTFKVPLFLLKQMK